MLGISSRIERGRISIGRLLSLLLAIGFVGLLAAGVALGLVVERNQQFTASVAHTYEVELAVASARQLVEQAETARRGFVLTADDAYLRVYDDAARELPKALGTFERLTADNPRQRAGLAALRPRVAALAEARERTIALVRRGRRNEAVDAFRAETSARRLREIRARFAAMTSEERRLLTLRDGARRSSVRNL